MTDQEQSKFEGWAVVETVKAIGAGAVSSEQDSDFDDQEEKF